MAEKKLRGLGSLISRTSAPIPAAPATVVSAEAAQAEQAAQAVASRAQLIDIPIDTVSPNPRQPRRTFNKEALDELASSIRQHGLLQPIVVRPGEPGKYELIAGERRWRAARLAGQATITAVCKPANNMESLTLSIIENLQRENLDPIEEASAYRTLINELNLTQEQVSLHVGKERSTIGNFLRLLDLPLSIQAKLQSGALTPGHARVLLAVTNPEMQRNLAERAAEKGLSVRDLERLVYGEVSTGGAVSGAVGGAPITPPKMKPAHIEELERRLAGRLGAKVRLKEGRRGGKLVIEFSNDREFLRILEILGINSKVV